MRWIFVLLMMSTVSEAAEFQLFELKEASVTYRSFQGGARDPLYTISPKVAEVETRLNVDVLRYMFFDNKVHGGMDQDQFRVVGWNYKLGARIAPCLDVQYEHHSQHLLDSAYPYSRFPVENSLGFTLYFYRDNNRGSLF